ncbi:vanadium-dependent haloperoxidase [Actinosynnema sp. NPDC051121]
MPRRPIPFDLDTGNAIRDVVIPAENPLFRTTVQPSDASLVIRYTVLLNNAWFDAIAPFHPTAVGIASRLGRRPASERRTNRERNIAILYASHRVLDSQLPRFRAQWRTMLVSAGLDPDDDSRDTATPAGIGNRAGEAVIASRLHDGMNQLGDEGGRRYDRQPYADYLGYRPVNTAETIHDPSRWQPNVVTGGNGAFRAQQFVTPQWSVTRPYSYGDPDEFDVPPPVNSDAVRDPAGYRRQADEILRASANLTDRQKVLAETFNDKFWALPPAYQHIAAVNDYDLDRFVFLDALSNVAPFDAGIACWHFKRRYDSVRPFTAIRHLYGDREITAWGGPGKGTVTDIRGSEWRSYLETADHPEYPSTSAAYCGAVAQAVRRFTGSDALGLSIRVAKGASLVEPGTTPRADTTLGPWKTLTEWEEDCGRSRLLGGVHFRSAIKAGRELGRRVGDRAYEFMKAHVEGTAPPPPTH